MRYPHRWGVFDAPDPTPYEQAEANAEVYEGLILLAIGFLLFAALVY